MTQQKLKLLFLGIAEKKKKIKIIKDMFKNALENDKDYPVILEDFKTLQAKKKAIETRIENELEADFDIVDNLKDEIKKDESIISDTIVTAMINGEVLKLEDSQGNKMEPEVKAKFKRK